MRTSCDTYSGVAAALERFPFRYFVVTFAWSWLIWLPLVLAGMGVIHLRKDPLDALTVPWVAVGVFGPAVGHGGGRLRAQQPTLAPGHRQQRRASHAG
ncbi:MAG: hypothetical protein ABR500_02360 [Dermatophilaceae bacterium]|nr:hypothetical protein [Intrasporangiaceae bacterium]